MGGTRSRGLALTVLPDVNLRVYGYRREYAHHERYKAWIESLLTGDEDLALAESALTGFLRIVTNTRIYEKPAPMAHALTFVNALRRAPRARPLQVTEAVWAAFDQLVRGDADIGGNVVPDAWLAALAIAHDCRLATADRGFARFPGLEAFNPAPT